MFLLLHHFLPTQQRRTCLETISFFNDPAEVGDALSPEGLMHTVTECNQTQLYPEGGCGKLGIKLA
eukprot:1115712-Pelagomonas_calceolata.AAC.3